MPYISSSLIWNVIINSQLKILPHSQDKSKIFGEDYKRNLQRTPPPGVNGEAASRPVKGKASGCDMIVYAGSARSECVLGAVGIVTSLTEI